MHPIKDGDHGGQVLVISCYLVSYAIVAIDDKDLHLDEAGYWLFWGGSSMSFTRNGVAKS